MSAAPQIAEAVQRLKAMFIEVPGTPLTIVEVSRLSGLEALMCEAILDALVATRFLTRGEDGRFRRLSE